MTKYALLTAGIEFLVIVGLLAFMFWPRPTVDLSKYQELEKKLTEERFEFETYKTTMKDKVAQIEEQNEALRAENAADETRKTENNEKMDSDVDIIRSSPLDTLIRTEYTRPEGF